MNTAILIPALNPTDMLVQYVDELIQTGFTNIIVVDDGSKDACGYIFDTISEREECTVLRHAVNLGKGRALKTGINHYLTTKTVEIGLISVDSDGQHTAGDVVRMARAMENESGICLGCRDFSLPSVPPKSRFGNKLTRVMFALLYGMRITDTQTGLRGFSNNALSPLLELAGERFEYETNVLIAAGRKGIPLTEISIDTVYINNNSETHFHPIRDSFKIYRVLLGEFLKYSVGSVCSFLVDISVFYVLSLLLAGFHKAEMIWLATIGARIISSLFNYLFNRNVVFGSREKRRYTMLKYYVLCTVQACVSSILLILAEKITVFPLVALKVIVDSLLFLLSFQVQKHWVFRGNKGRHE